MLLRYKHYLINQTTSEGELAHIEIGSQPLSQTQMQFTAVFIFVRNCYPCYRDHSQVKFVKPMLTVTKRLFYAI